MKNTRRRFTAKFKAQVAIEAIKERERMTELAKCFEVHPAQITTWKREYLERADQAFGGTSDAPKLTALESERDDLYRNVGELEMQRDFF
ncbi:transposase [Polaromonas sp.]|jgi:transposase|uniref:transposase n=1 Tax=Polaromonas sp. TaxID=1869339 RepID=UPI0037C60E6C